MCNRVHEIDRRPVGIHVVEVELDELQIAEMVVNHHLPTLVREVLEGRAIGNGGSAVNEVDRPGGVDRVHGSHVRQLINVMGAVAVNISRVVDGVFLHPVVRDR